MAEPFNLADMADPSLPVDPADPDFRWTDWIAVQAAQATQPVRAALGHDVTPGHDELHHWWVYGPGRERWHTWTELYTELLEHVSENRARLFASKWFKERYGYSAGSDLNRVKHGKPPRGHRVGPG